MTDATLDLDIDLSGETLTLGEIIEVEELSGERVFDRSGRFLRAVAWAHARRQNPDVKLEELDGLQVRFDRG